jgi:hypothetical protein
VNKAQFRVQPDLPGSSGHQGPLDQSEQEPGACRYHRSRDPAKEPPGGQYLYNSRGHSLTSVGLDSRYRVGERRSKSLTHHWPQQRRLFRESEKTGPSVLKGRLLLAGIHLLLPLLRPGRQIRTQISLAPDLIGGRVSLVASAHQAGVVFDEGTPGALLASLLHAASAHALAFDQHQYISKSISVDMKG